jgi:hypothetical protein
MAGLPGPFAEEDPARVARLNQLIGQVVASHPGTYQLDLRTYMRDRPGGELDLAWRPDGFHWTDVRPRSAVARAAAGQLRPGDLTLTRDEPGPGAAATGP